MGNPHVLAIPYPAQGHVLPLMEVSLCLVQNGIKVTFVNTDFNHTRVVKALSAGGGDISHAVSLVSISDGLDLDADRSELGQLTESMERIMPGKLEELIKEINSSDKDPITCIIADLTVAWALEVAENMNIRRAAFMPTAVATSALLYSIPKLISEGVIDEIGTPLKSEMIKLSPEMPAMNPADFSWTLLGGKKSQEIIFDMCRRNVEIVKNLAEWFVANSTYDLEPAAFSLVPSLIPIGPLLASNRMGSSAGSFWPEDSTCLKWLDRQAPSSVIYVAFGSFTVFDRKQFQELALGLELTNKPFLWVVRPDITEASAEAYPDGFLERVANRGKVVGWAPQQKVLSHPAIACFLSHCGWNSIVEGLSSGLPFLCWPYFGDQLLNETYIRDVWKTGLGFDKDGNGIITMDEIAAKVVKLLGDETYTERAIELKDKTITSIKEGGCSYVNFKNLIQWMKA